MGAPIPAVTAFVATWVEVLGGLALILGVLVPVFGVLLFLVMAGAFFIAHVDNGVYAADGGFELVTALGLGALLLAVVGAGAFGVDCFLAPHNRECDERLRVHHPQPLSFYRPVSADSVYLSPNDP